MGEARKAGWLLALVAVVVLLGCGDGDSTSAAEVKDPLYPWLKGPTREFLVRDGDNAVQTFGREASNVEREQASRTIAAWMRARAATNWKKDCSYFSRRYVKALVWEDAYHVSNEKVKSCPQALVFFGEAASGDYKNTLTGPIDSLRVGEGHAYAQYHGRGGKDWIVPMDREDGEWLVANSTPIGRNE